MDYSSLMGEINPNHISFTIGDSGAIYHKNGFVELLTLDKLLKLLGNYDGDVDSLLDSTYFMPSRYILRQHL